MNQTALLNKINLLKNGNVSTPKGFSAGGLHCGIRKKKLDLGWIYSEIPAKATGVYTTNTFQAAPLQVTKESIAKEKILQTIVVNSGVANACTGVQGLDDAYEMRELIAEKFQVPLHYAAVSSTGLIGAHLPMQAIRKGIDQINTDSQRCEQFKTAILTTDTIEKGVAVSFELDGKEVTIGGAAKGSGMIKPNMATMLGFITTDANIEQEALDKVLKQVTNDSFNMITVDGDTSTNDMVLLLANGLAENEPLTIDHPEWETFVEALAFVCQTLAKQIARDGEGATKLIEVYVEGASTKQDAEQVSKSVISSNLVKTAIHGADANWGRIITAIGYSGVQVNPDQVSVSLGPIQVVKSGVPIPFNETKAKDYLSQDSVSINISIGTGINHAVGWGCDLSYEYVRINASYRT